MNGTINHISVLGTPAQWPNWNSNVSRKRKSNPPLNQFRKRGRYFQDANDHTMTLTELDNLATELDSRQLFLRLLLRDDRFRMLLEQPTAGTPAAMCVLLSAIGKICDRPTANISILLKRLLGKILRCEQFLTTKVRSFIDQLNEHMYEMTRNVYLAATHNLLQFMRQLQLLLPRASIRTIETIAPLLTAQINYINRDEIIIEKECIELMVTINECLVKATTTVKPNATKQTKGFRDIDIWPCSKEILSDDLIVIRPNIINGKYAGGVDHYLDIQFRLLREDFVRPLREGIRNGSQLMRSGSRNSDAINIYRNVVITGYILKRGARVYNATFDSADLHYVKWVVKLIKRIFDEYKQTAC